MNSLAKIGTDSIISSSVIGQDDVEQLLSIRDSLIRAADSQVIWRTEVEARVSVLGDLRFPTPAAKFHQSVREQLVFLDELLRLSFDYRRKLLDLEEIDAKLDEATQGSIEARRLEIDREDALYSLEVMQRHGRERVREIMMWEKLKNEQLDADGSIHPEDKNADQLRGLALNSIRSLPAALKARDGVGAANNMIDLAMTSLAECDRRGIDLGREGAEARKMLKKAGVV